MQQYSIFGVCVCRFGPSTPVAIETTANLVRCQILDRSGKLERDDLVLLYGMALTRCVCVFLYPLMRVMSWNTQRCGLTTYTFPN